MDELEELKLKVEEAVRQLKRFKEERRNLLAELEILREENERARRLVRENEALRRVQLRFKTRLERIASKISQMDVN
jgi:hypothetical protein